MACQALSQTEAPSLLIKTQSPYKKYHLKNKTKTPVRPFYVWNDTFFANYSKLQQRNRSIDQGAAKAIKFNQTFQEGMFRSNNICLSPLVEEDQRTVDEDSSWHQSLVGVPLKSNLFNAKDKIRPINKYYYDKEGVMKHANRQEKALSVSKHISQIEKVLQLLQFTNKYGTQGRRMFEQEQITQEALRQENLRTLPSQNQESPVQQDDKQRFDHFPKSLKGAIQSNQYSSLSPHGSRKTSSKFYAQLSLSKKQPMIRVHLNGLTRERRIYQKSEVISGRDAHHFYQTNQQFLNKCMDLFDYDKPLRFLFSKDGSPIEDIQSFLRQSACLQVTDVFVSAHPYFVGQDPLRNSFEGPSSDSLDNLSDYCMSPIQPNDFQQSHEKRNWLKLHQMELNSNIETRKSSNLVPCFEPKRKQTQTLFQSAMKNQEVKRQMRVKRLTSLGLKVDIQQ